MTALSLGNRILLLLSLLLGLLLTVYPLGDIGRWWRPEFVVLLAIYWVIAKPQELGPFIMWLLGLLQDLIEGTLLGQHALGLVLVVYICLLSYQRLRNYALWQQSTWVFVLVGIHQLFGNWAYSLTGNAAQNLSFLLPALSSALCWPLLVTGLNRLRTYYRLL